MSVRAKLRTVAVLIALIFVLSSCGIVQNVIEQQSNTGEADQQLYNAISATPNFEAVKEAVEQGADVNILRVWPTKTNVLRYYSKEHMGEDTFQNHTGVNVAEYLLQHGADPDYILDHHGVSLLMYSCGALPVSGGGASVLFDLLLDAGADVDLVDHDGRSALDYAVGCNDPYQVERLLSMGATCSAQTLEWALDPYYDDPLLSVAPKCQIAKLVLDRCIETESALLQGDPSISLCAAAVQGDSGTVISNLRANAYHFEEGSPYTASLLISAFCNVDALKDLEEAGCLLTGSHFYAAISSGNEETAVYLQGKTTSAAQALAVAVHYGQAELTQYFIGECKEGPAFSGAENAWELDLAHSSQALSSDADVMLLSAAQSGNVDVLRSIYEFGGSYSPDAVYLALELGVFYDHPAVLRYLIEEAGADPDYHPYSESLLEMSVLHGNQDCFQYLLAHSDIAALDSAERILASAIAKGNTAALKTLLELGFDPNCADADGNPLVEAIRRGNLEAVELLLEYHADVNLKLEVGDPTGAESHRYTYPIHEAARNLSGRILTRLIDAGASLELVDSDGNTPKDLAINSQNRSIIDRRGSDERDSPLP